MINYPDGLLFGDLWNETDLCSLKANSEGMEAPLQFAWEPCKAGILFTYIFVVVRSGNWSLLLSRILYFSKMFNPLRPLPPPHILPPTDPLSTLFSVHFNFFFLLLSPGAQFFPAYSPHLSLKLEYWSQEIVNLSGCCYDWPLYSALQPPWMRNRGNQATSVLGRRW